ncbi:MAG: hypothetical protein MI975_25595 [Cytophagales bacterium]|nr:hypothetical protein [Cytophagales bacterium]
MKTFKIVAGLLAIAFLLSYVWMSQSPISFLYHLVEGTLIAGTIYGIVLLYADCNFRVKRGKGIVFILFATTIATHVMRILYLLDAESKEIKLVYFFKSYLFAHTLMVAGNAVLIGLVVCLLIWLFRQPKQKIIKTTGVSLAVTAVISTLLYLYLQRDMSDEKIYFNYDISTLSDIQDFASYEQKMVYLDFWHSGCRPCLEEFQHHSEFRNLLDNNEVNLMFIGVDRSKPGEKMKQRLLIEKYDLQGTHSFVRLEEFHQILDDAGYDVHTHGSKAFPHHMIIDPDGTVQEIKAEKPTPELAVKLNNMR